MINDKETKLAENAKGGSWLIFFFPPIHITPANKLAISSSRISFMEPYLKKSPSHTNTRTQKASVGALDLKEAFMGNRAARPLHKSITKPLNTKRSCSIMDEIISSLPSGMTFILAKYSQ